MKAKFFEVPYKFDVCYWKSAYVREIEPWPHLKYLEKALEQYNLCNLQTVECRTVFFYEKWCVIAFFLLYTECY